MKKLLTALFSIFLLYGYSATTFTITTTSVPDGYCQHPYSAKLLTTGAVSPVTFSKTSGSFPSGVQIAPSTGLISGSPGIFTNTTYTFVITAIDYAGNTASRPYSFTFTNYQILNTDFVRTATQVDNTQSYWYQYYDINNNRYNVPNIVGVSPVTVSYPQTWYGNAPSYTITVVNGGNLTAVSSGIYTPSVTAVSNITIVDVQSAQWSRVGNIVSVSGEFVVNANISALAVIRFMPPITTAANGVSEISGTSVAIPPTGVFISGTVLNSNVDGRCWLNFVTPATVSSADQLAIPYSYIYKIE